MKILNYEFGRADYLFIAISLLLLYLNFSFISELRQVPSPPYGGDYYNGLGGVTHIVDGGSVFGSAQMAGEAPWVPWLYHLLVAVFAKLTALEPWKALVYFSLVMEIFSLAVVYLLLQKISENKYLSIVGSVLFVSFFPLFKYSDFATWLVVPAFVLSLFLLFEKTSLKHAVFAGIMLGLMGLSNTQAFFVGFIMFGFFTLISLAPKLKEKPTVEMLKPYAITFLIGFLLSMPFWFWPIFVYHGQTLNPIQDITTSDVRNPVYLQEVISVTLISFLLPYMSSNYGVLFALLNLAGLGFLLNLKDRNNQFVLVLLLALLFSLFHTLITVPLLDMQFMISMMTGRVVPTLNVILVVLGAGMLLKLVASANIRLAAMLLLILLSLLCTSSLLDAKNNDRWIQYGKTELLPIYTELGSWIRANTDVNDVFLTTNEGGFMMNAFTGRKVVSYRRAHSSPYTDMNKRMADQAVMVYGSNPSETMALLEEYNVKYVLWSNRWIFDEFQFDEQGRLVGFFDPLDVPNEPEYRQYWDSNGVAYINVNMSLDPAPPQGVPIYDVLVALPTEPSIEKPYSQNLADYLVLKKVISYESVDYFRIYEVRR